MIATAPAKTPYVPWYVRWELTAILPSTLLAAFMIWCVVQSIASANWAEGLEVLSMVALPALLVGFIFARLRWLPGWLAHLLSAALGIAWSIQLIGPLLVQQVAIEFTPQLATRLVSWGDHANEILIRIILWARTLEAGGRGEDIILFIVALAMLAWMVGYLSGWLLFRAHQAWPAVVLNGLVILINYTFTSPKPNELFFAFLGTALLLIAYQNVLQHQRLWRAALIEYPDSMPWRFLIAAALFCSLIVIVTSILPSNVSSVQVARVWRIISTPLTSIRESWEDAFSTINAPAGAVGGGFTTRNVQVGGPRSVGNAIVLRMHSTKYDYWRAAAFDKYTGHSWQSTVGERARSVLNVGTIEQARSLIEPNTQVPQLDLSGRKLVTQTVELLQPREDHLIIMGGQFASAEQPVLIQHGFLVDDSGQVLPNFGETSAIFSEMPLQPTTVYTTSGYISTVDEQSLRNAGTVYPRWISSFYLQLPESVTARTKIRAQQIVQQANARSPYDQAKAIEEYLRQLVYDEQRQSPPGTIDWVDYFLFNSQRGYCDDFASAMVVMLRALNVPARWVQGYAGGEIEPQSNIYVVRESIAHSWPEVYFPGFGWQRFEPTPASYANLPIRPAVPLPDAGSSVTSTSTLSYTGDASEARLRELMEEQLRRQEAASNQEALQRALAERLAAAQAQRFAILGGIGTVILMGLALFFMILWREVRGLPPATAMYVRLSRLAGWAGLAQARHDTPYEYAGMLEQKLPQQRAQIERIAHGYVLERYQSAAQPNAQELEQDWRRLRPALLRYIANQIGTLAFWRTPANQRRRRR